MDGYEIKLGYLRSHTMAEPLPAFPEEFLARRIEFARVLADIKFLRQASKAYPAKEVTKDVLRLAGKWERFQAAKTQKEWQEVYNTSRETLGMEVIHTAILARQRSDKVHLKRDGNHYKPWLSRAAYFDRQIFKFYTKHHNGITEMAETIIDRIDKLKGSGAEVRAPELESMKSRMHTILERAKRAPAPPDVPAGIQEWITDFQTEKGDIPRSKLKGFYSWCVAYDDDEEVRTAICDRYFNFIFMCQIIRLKGEHRHVFAPKTLIKTLDKETEVYSDAEGEGEDDEYGEEGTSDEGSGGESETETEEDEDLPEIDKLTIGEALKRMTGLGIDEPRVITMRGGREVKVGEEKAKKGDGDEKEDDEDEEEEEEDEDQLDEDQSRIDRVKTQSGRILRRGFAYLSHSHSVRHLDTRSFELDSRLTSDRTSLVYPRVCAIVKQPKGKIGIVAFKHVAKLLDFAQTLDRWLGKGGGENRTLDSLCQDLDPLLRMFQDAAGSSPEGIRDFIDKTIEAARVEEVMAIDKTKRPEAFFKRVMQSIQLIPVEVTDDPSLQDIEEEKKKK